METGQQLKHEVADTKLLNVGSQFASLAQGTGKPHLQAGYR
jgi:hypothetical protein